MLKPEMLCVCWCSAAALQTSFSLPTAAQITGSPPARMCGLGLLIMSTAWQRGKKKKNTQTHSQQGCAELPWQSLWACDEYLVIKLIPGRLIVVSGGWGTSCKHLHKHLIPGTHVRACDGEGRGSSLMSVLRVRVNQCCCIFLSEKKKKNRSGRSQMNV